ncbi:MAG: helix-turn-helix transcriptional regulator [Pseudomonadota bacterium]
MSDELLRAVGARVRGLREARGASQEGFAKEVGMDRAYFGRIERGRQNMSIGTAAKIATALDVSLAELFEGAPPAGSAQNPTG